MDGVYSTRTLKIGVNREAAIRVMYECLCRMAILFGRMPIVSLILCS